MWTKTSHLHQMYCNVLSGNLAWKIAMLFPLNVADLFALKSGGGWFHLKEWLWIMVFPCFSCLESVTFLSVRSWPLVGFCTRIIELMSFRLKAHQQTSGCCSKTWKFPGNSQVPGSRRFLFPQNPMVSQPETAPGGSHHLRPKNLGLLRGRRSSGIH